MEEKRKDLTASKQRQLFNKIIAELNRSNPSFYYLSTSEIAYEIELFIKSGEGLTTTEMDILSDLNRTDIQMLLSLHND